MGLIDSIKGLIDPFRVEARSAATVHAVSYEYPDLQTQLQHHDRLAAGARLRAAVGRARRWACRRSCAASRSSATARASSPCRASATASPMDDSPRLITRPDPTRTPRDFYAPSACNMATYGEVVWYIALVDADGLAHGAGGGAAARADRRAEPGRPPPRRCTSGATAPGPIVSTRWTPANPTGGSCTCTSTPEPGELRGEGPLQLGRRGGVGVGRGAGLGGQLLRAAAATRRSSCTPRTSSRTPRPSRAARPVGAHAAQHAARHVGRPRRQRVRGQPAGRPDARRAQPPGRRGGAHVRRARVAGRVQRTRRSR